MYILKDVLINFLHILAYKIQNPLHSNNVEGEEETMNKETFTDNDSITVPVSIS